MAESIGNTGKGMKLHTKILLGLLIGAVIGITANQTLGGTHPTVVRVNTYLAGPIGQIFLRMLFMVVIPLVFASISLGVAGLGDLRRVGRVGTKAITYFLLSTALAATLGLIAVSIVRPARKPAADLRRGRVQPCRGLQATGLRHQHPGQHRDQKSGKIGGRSRPAGDHLLLAHIRRCAHADPG
jgi:DAACS family dicarboxylate/amino acid:cation (Na+ or H+) symporter